MELWQLDSIVCAIIHDLLTASSGPWIELSAWNFEPRKERSCDERGRRETEKRKQTWAVGEEKILLKKLPGQKYKTLSTLMLWFYPSVDYTQKILSTFTSLRFFSFRQGCITFFSYCHLSIKNLRPFSEAWSYFGFCEAAWCHRKLGSLKSNRLGFVPFSATY